VEVTFDRAKHHSFARKMRSLFVRKWPELINVECSLWVALSMRLGEGKPQSEGKSAVLSIDPGFNSALALPAGEQQSPVGVGTV
jgi:hypothetical protein